MDESTPRAMLTARIFSVESYTSSAHVSEVLAMFTGSSTRMSQRIVTIGVPLAITLLAPGRLSVGAITYVTLPGSSCWLGAWFCTRRLCPPPVLVMFVILTIGRAVTVG